MKRSRRSTSAVLTCLLLSAGMPGAVRALQAGRPATWTLSDRPTLEIGPAQGVEWGRIAGVAWHPRGLVMASDVLSHRVAVYDTEGRRIMNAGRAGDGPGEFLGMSAPMACDSTSVTVWDSGHDRISAFGLDGELKREFSQGELRAADASGGIWSPRRLRCAVDGTFVLSSERLPMPPVEGPQTREVRLEITSPSGERVVIGSFSIDAIMVGGDLGPQPLGATTLIATAPDRIYAARSDSFLVHAFSRSGEPLGVIGDGHVGRKIDSGVIERFLAPGTAASRAWYRDMEFPERLPVMSALLVDDEGNLWIREHALDPREAATWQVYDSGGAHLATVRMPAGFIASDVAATGVLGIWRDEYDVDHVRVYALERGG